MSLWGIRIQEQQELKQTLYTATKNKILSKGDKI